MASAYPGALDSFATNKTDSTNTATDHAATHNDNADAINKIEAELGVNPSGSYATVVARLNQVVTVRKTADQTNTLATSTTLENITDLALAVTVGADHFFEFYVPYTSSATTNGIGFAVTVPALNAGGYVSYMVEISGRAANPAVGGAMALTTVPYHVHAVASGGGTATASESVAATTSAYMARITGVLSNPSATGNIQLQYRSEVAAQTVVAKKGAVGRLTVN